MEKKETNKKSLFKNMFSTIVLTFITAAVGLILPRLYMLKYGSEVNGIINTITNFTTYFSYVEAGLGMALMSMLYKPLAGNEYDKINQIVSYSKKSYEKVSFIYFILVMILSIFFPLLSKTDALSTFEFFSLTFVIGISGAIGFYTMSKYRVLLTADRKEYIVSYAMAASQILRFIFVWIYLTYFDLSVVIVKIIPIAVLLIRTLILKMYVKAKYPNISFKEDYSKADFDYKKRYDALILQLNINSNISFAVIIISQIIDYIAANVFSVYNMVVSEIISIVSIASAGVAPVMGNIMAKDKEVIKEFYDNYEIFVQVLLMVVFSVSAVMLTPIVKIYTSGITDAEYTNQWYGILFSVWAMLFTYRIPVTAIINSAGLFRENRKTNLYNLVLLIVITPILTYFFKIYGALIALIIVSLHRNICMLTIVYKIVLQKLPFNAIKRMLIMIINLILVCFTAKFFNTGGVETITQWIIYAIVFTAVSTVYTISLVMLTDYNSFKGLIKFLKVYILKK